jgi:hypothetical protein
LGPPWKVSWLSYTSCNQFQGNSAIFYGELIYLRHCYSNLSYNTFNQDVAGDMGGEVYATENPIESIKNKLINNAVANEWGADYIDKGSAYIYGD